MMVRSVKNPYLANKLQNQLSMCHIIALHVISFGGLIIGGNFSDKDDEQKIVNLLTINQRSIFEDN